MSTRHRDGDGPIAQNGYASAPEFLELRGINGVMVSMRTAVLLKEEKKQLLWFIQALSGREGGLKRVARELLEMFPDRLGTPAMHDAGVRPGKMFPGELVGKVRLQIFDRSQFLPGRVFESEKAEKLLGWCSSVALGIPTFRNSSTWTRGPLAIDEFLERLCISGKMAFSIPGEPADFAEAESSLAIEQDPDLKHSDIERGDLVYFRDIIGALVEYKKRHEQKSRDSFYLTSIGKQVWKALDDALASGRMIAVDGPEGRGKTEAAKAWCELHLGSARFVSLKGITTKTAAFREIAKALGTACSYTRTATDIQARIEDVLKRSKIMLVLDEAHFLFNQGRRVYTRPELIDWIDTAVCNAGVPCALVTTPQFMICLTRAADQVEWNYRQFRRRVKWVKLPDEKEEESEKGKLVVLEDVRAAVRFVFKGASPEVIKKIVGYTLLSKRHVSAIGDIVKEVHAMRGCKDLNMVSVEEANKAIRESLRSDESFQERLNESRQHGRRRGKIAAGIAHLQPVVPEDDREDSHIICATHPSPIDPIYSEIAN